jgi:hypothetical protein
MVCRTVLMIHRMILRVHRAVALDASERDVAWLVRLGLVELGHRWSRCRQR